MIATRQLRSLAAVGFFFGDFIPLEIAAAGANGESTDLIGECRNQRCHDENHTQIEHTHVHHATACEGQPRPRGRPGLRGLSRKGCP
jgi:hypothetical protein